MQLRLIPLNLKGRFFAQHKDVWHLVLPTNDQIFKLEWLRMAFKFDVIWASSKDVISSKTFTAELPNCDKALWPNYWTKTEWWKENIHIFYLLLCTCWVMVLLLKTFVNCKFFTSRAGQVLLRHLHHHIIIIIIIIIRWHLQNLTLTTPITPTTPRLVFVKRSFTCYGYCAYILKDWATDEAKKGECV